VTGTAEHVTNLLQKCNITAEIDVKNFHGCKTPLKQLISTDTILNKKGDNSIAAIDILAICC